MKCFSLRSLVEQSGKQVFVEGGALWRDSVNIAGDVVVPRGRSDCDAAIFRIAAAFTILGQRRRSFFRFWVWGPRRGGSLFCDPRRRVIFCSRRPCRRGGRGGRRWYDSNRAAFLDSLWHYGRGFGLRGLGWLLRGMRGRARVRGLHERRRGAAPSEENRRGRELWFRGLAGFRRGRNVCLFLRRTPDRRGF
jgi:hypothetical protein